MTGVSIVYCKPCGYEKRATEAAAALRAKLNVTANLVPGKGGIFEVRVGDKVADKRTFGHFSRCGGDRRRGFRRAQSWAGVIEIGVASTPALRTPSTILSASARSLNGNRSI